jgi:hypothetical protein
MSIPTLLRVLLSNYLAIIQYNKAGHLSRAGKSHNLENINLDLGLGEIILDSEIIGLS